MKLRIFLFLWWLVLLPFLYGDAATHLVENGGDPGRAMRAMGRNGTALNIARSMVTAGLVSEVSGVAGIRTTDLELVDYAKKAAIQSAVNTAMSVAEGQDVGQALCQGAVWMAVNTAASWGAGSIGDARSADQGADRISAATHKILHGMLGAGLGSATAAITGSDVGIGALSGAVGSVVAEMTAEGLDSKDATDHQRAITAQVANLTATVVAFTAGLDAGIALSAAQNATTHNFLAHPGDRMYLEELGIMEEGELALGEGERDGRISPSIVLQEAIEEYHQGIEQEQLLRQGEDISLTDRAASRFREWNMNCALGEASEALSHRSIHKATFRLAEGTSTAEDRQMLLLGIGRVVASGMSGGRGKAPGAPVAPRAVKEGAAKSGVAPSVKHRAYEADDAKALMKPKSSEQPWTIRSGQEWKTKVFGKAQVTGGRDVVSGEAHAFRSYREAIAAAKREDVSSVFLNRGIRKATDHPIPKPNTRPDVTIRRADGVIEQVEVKSRTDIVRDLYARMDATEGRLPASMQGGEKKVVEFTKATE